MARPTKLTPAKVPRETARHLEAFEAWYAAAQNWSIVAQNRTISRSLLYDWADKFNWHARADERDRKAAELADAAAVRERAKRLEDQRKAGTLLRSRGVEYLAKHEIEDERAAIAAIKTGTEIERQSDGLPQWILAVVNANPDELSADSAEVEAEIERRFLERRGLAALPESGETETTE